ncbi:MAG: type II toxin-antitoxin system VapC family toxin [Phycisphaerales bacterium]|nr:type II toxin-antitoxin system VapC family toxin [Phycisphaerales bacterium]
MAWVLDSSVALAWCFDDEKTDATTKLSHRLVDDGDDFAVVPQHWHLEVTNVLAQAMRKRPPRLTLARRAELLTFLKRSRITVDESTTERAWTTTLELADKHALSSYDAAYLELAMRLDIELATLDNKLRAAAKSEGVKVIP